MRRAQRWILGTAVSLASLILGSAACSSSSDDPLAPTSSGGRLPPTSSPGVTGAVDEGAAQVQVRGGLTVDTAFEGLGTPAIWRPAPGGMALNWLSSEGGTFGISGSSFQGTVQTGSALRLELEIPGNDGSVAFRSDDGTCSVTIESALVNEVSGSFTCSGLESTESSIAVDATGTFTATG